MADDGLEFSTDMTDLTTKMNRKTWTVGRGRQLNSLFATYPGKTLFCTETENGFTKDYYYRRKADNSGYNSHYAQGESIEQSVSSPVQTTDSSLTLGIKWYTHQTLPTTEDFYVITKMEWYNGASIAGNILCGVDIIDAIEPILDPTPLVALSREVAAAGTNQIQSTSAIVSSAIRGGTKIGCWVMGSANTNLGYTTPTSPPARKDTVYTQIQPSVNVVGWTQQALEIYLKIYFRGYG